MAKHTSGPWQFIPALPRSVYAGTDDDPICIGRTDLPNIPLAEASANARMFAAAPDMLHALRLARGSLLGCITEAERNETLAAIRAAITKAEQVDA